MLVLTREAGQSIVLGDEAQVKVKILTNDGRHVRIGVEAPRHVTVHREEVHRRIQGKNKRIVSSTNREQG